MYDAADRRFMAVDPVKGDRTKPISLVQYIYCLDNALLNVDPLGLWGSDVHYGKTKAWAQEKIAYDWIKNSEGAYFFTEVACFTKAAAEIIANEDNLVDIASKTTPLVNKNPKNQSWHYNMDKYLDNTGKDTRDTHNMPEITPVIGNKNYAKKLANLPSERPLF